MDPFIPVAVPARIFIRGKRVEAAAVAHLAFHIKGEYMFRMAMGFLHRDGTLRDLAQMAISALNPGLLPAMGLRKFSLSLDHICNEKLILFDQGEVVALLTDNIPVLSPLPFVERLFHHMAGHAEFGFLLGMPVILISHHNPENADNRDQGEDKSLEVVKEVFHELGEFVVEPFLHSRKAGGGNLRPLFIE
jgi:hypothetical protein